MDKPLKPTVYVKHHSFESFRSGRVQAIAEQTERALRILDAWREGNAPPGARLAAMQNLDSVLSRCLSDLRNPDADRPCFAITQFIADEMQTYDDTEILRFLYHRYRYDVFPALRELDAYPPYLQIEPSSLCNYRCVFCYQTDTDFFQKKNDAMGMMSLEVYQSLVDAAAGNCEFLSLASRGEPTMSRELGRMLQYSSGKFLNLKLNTNASLLTEPLIHAILSGGVRTVVFSADAAAEPLYSQLRVNGKLDRVLKNIELFYKIRREQYSSARVITRVSGVKVNEAQSMSSMEDLWGGLVDQVTFVHYNPWENIYQSKPNGLKTPCSDLWRRMFVWHDGRVNPCDSDYASKLSVGQSSIGLSQLWLGQAYSDLRAAHLGGNRQIVEPCKRCAVT